MYAMCVNFVSSRKSFKPSKSLRKPTPIQLPRTTMRRDWELTAGLRRVTRKIMMRKLLLTSISARVCVCVCVCVAAYKCNGMRAKSGADNRKCSDRLMNEFTGSKPRYTWNTQLIPSIERVIHLRYTFPLWTLQTKVVDDWVLAPC